MPPPSLALLAKAPQPTLALPAYLVLDLFLRSLDISCEKSKHPYPSSVFLRLGKVVDASLIIC